MAAKSVSGLQGAVPKYVFCNGLRYVEPYHFQYDITPKQRWVGKRVLDIFCDEFFAYDAYNYYVNAINKSLITVNHRPISLDYIFKAHDRIIHKMHRHEPPICSNDDDIQLIEAHSSSTDFIRSKNLIVANKPCSVPVHPVGRYRYNSLRLILCGLLNKSVANVHRIDSVSSGLTIFTTDKTPKKYNGKIHRQFEKNEIEKVYVAKVFGDFQPEKISVNAPIGVKTERTQINGASVNDAAYIQYCVDLLNGKESVTDFEKISYDGTYSLVECRPKTGRSHQIRIHLQYIGFPILNDVKYGGIEMEGSEYQMNPYLDDEKGTLKNMILDHWDENCVECQMILKEINGEIKSPFDGTKQICLHSLRYESPKDGWIYETELPKWAL